MTTPLDILRHYVSGAIDRGEAAPIVAVTEDPYAADSDASTDWRFGMPEPEFDTNVEFDPDLADLPDFADSYEGYVA